MVVLSKELLDREDSYKHQVQVMKEQLWRAEEEQVACFATLSAIEVYRHSHFVGLSTKGKSRATDRNQVSP